MVSCCVVCFGFWLHIIIKKNTVNLERILKNSNRNGELAGGMDILGKKSLFKEMPPSRKLLRFKKEFK